MNFFFLPYFMFAYQHRIGLIPHLLPPLPHFSHNFNQIVYRGKNKQIKNLYLKKS